MKSTAWAENMELHIHIHNTMVHVCTILFFSLGVTGGGAWFFNLKRYLVGARPTQNWRHLQRIPA